MAKDEPELMVMFVLDHGDGTCTVTAWGDVGVENYDQLLDLFKEGAGSPDHQQIVPMEYNEDGGPRGSVFLSKAD